MKSTVTLTMADVVPKTEYVLIYSTIGEIFYCSKARMHEHLQAMLHAGNIQDVRIIRVHKDMPYYSGLAIAEYYDGVCEFIALCDEGLTPYQALEDLDLL